MDDILSTQVRLAEERLRLAMLASDVAELDALIDDRLLFIAPDAQLYTKKDDLDLHRLRHQRISQLDVIELKIEAHAHLVIVVLLAQMAGSFKGQSFEGRFRYMRCWANTNLGWRVVAGSVGAVTT